jgi:transposase InsO family protein
MDGKGRAIDNTFIESLWRSVKYENVYLQAYANTLELYNRLKEYFRFYNHERFSSLCYLNFGFRDVLRSSSIIRLSNIK